MRKSQRKTVKCGKMSHLYETCSKCFPAEERRAITFPRGPKHAEIMVIGQGPSLAKKLPSPRETLKLSKAAKVFCKCLREIGINPKDVYFTNLVKCSSLSQNKEGTIDNCYLFLRDEIVELNPERIIVLGSRAGKFLMRKYYDDERFRYICHPAQRMLKREEYVNRIKSVLTKKE